MIVDDDRTTVTLLKTLLEMDGFEVSLVPRGGMVLEKARQERPDIFLLDYHLSDMEGTTVAVALRADPQFAKTPIIMSSGLNVEDEAKKAGASMFLVKPFEPSSLAGLFNKLLE
jgi:two-component system chemotaxis response regulator CheY